MTHNEFIAAMQMYGLSTEYPQEGVVYTINHYHPKTPASWELLVRWHGDKSAPKIVYILDVGLLLWHTAGVVELEGSADTLHEAMGDILTAIYERNPFTMLDNYMWTADPEVESMIDEYRIKYEQTNKR